MYDKAQSTILLNGSTGDGFRTTVQSGSDKDIYFYIFLKRITCETLIDHERSVSIRERLITNLRFADDIVVNAEEEGKVDVLVDRLTVPRRNFCCGS